ncbi:PAS domain-containing sensor histidine kinase [Sphingomonas sp. Leaf339]|uniref:sensor histidine kinase n=1 Tax=Sphingomonas sp. Leaf339 TaxID=1736343 RepID=UPI0006FA42F1|nr:ATP-binding protein [Sphingomonas sp. Leaf339]KQU55734.1 PAS domain-containing sensor histidine kinase [Sphingomonas sp. Leaf339]
MIAVATPNSLDDTPMRRFTVTPLVELIVLGIAIGVAIVSYLLLSGADNPQRLIAPPFVALLLVANLVPGILLLMLLGRRIARRRAALSPIGGEGRLHVRLVALFSVVAAVPMLLVTIFASLLFQYGVQFWYSDRARGVFENATELTRSSYNLILQRWADATVTMADDLAFSLRDEPIDSRRFQEYFARQVYYRSLSEGALFAIGPNGDIQTLAIVNPYEVDFGRQITAKSIAKLGDGQRSQVIVNGDRIQTFTRLPGASGIYLYAARVSTNPGEMTAQTERALAAQADYRALLARARYLQIRFNAALLIISLLIVGVAVWIALAVADRLVRPVGELVDAARRVASGDLSARVADPRARDEVGTLAMAFNRMTERLQEQNTALLTANDQLDSRRALIEAVMAGVSAGVVATGADRRISIANASAVQLLGAHADGVVGRSLRDVAPELDALVGTGIREAVVQVGEGLQAKTLAVRLAEIDRGPILTFDDVTQQLSDQRRAAWADVARRIAHEIKNPLTPIQLAAERLQRRYGSKIEADDGTFARLTETIVRQVGDLRRMVDEFSSFARMPKPVFNREPLLDAARQVMFLHEVAHPTIRFTVDYCEPAPVMVCDRRQIGQALTNIVKNAVEAIEAKGAVDGEVVLTLGEFDEGRIGIIVTDNGVGLPAARDRIVEPYMTTRARGTGLGLAIVSKIVEDHGGTIAFTDRPGGGTVVTMMFDAARLETLDQGDQNHEPAGEGQLAALTSNRT